MGDATTIVGELREAWRTNHRINLFLIDRISDEGMGCTLSKRGGRDVVRQLAHLHNIRVARLQGWAKELAAGIATFATHDRPDRDTLKARLDESAAAADRYIELAASGAPRVKTLRKGLAVSIAYLLAHESHHRGSILLTLKECGHKVDQDTQYAIWDWDKM